MLKFLVFVSVGLLVSCGNQFENHGDKTVFKYNEIAGITSMDPAFARDQANIWVCNQIFNGLVELNDSLKVVPSIAKGWEITNNGTLYIFHLRQDVFFHDDMSFPKETGRKVVANDFEYSINRVLSDKLHSPGAVWINSIIKKSGDKFKINAINDSTLSIELVNPFPPFLGILSMQYFSVIPREAVDYYGEEVGRHPVGTGPFYFKMLKEGVKLVLLKNEKYFEVENNERLPYLDAVSVSFIIDKQSVFLEFTKGNLDFISGIDPSYKDEVLNPDGSLREKYRQTINMSSAPYLNTEYFGFLVDPNFTKSNNPVSQIKVRQALNYGFDRVKMMRYLRNNIGIPGLHGFVPVGMPGFGDEKTKGYDYNPDLSRKLLKEAGYEHGVGLPIITISTTASYLDIAKYIQQQLNEIGFKIEIDVQQPAALRQMVANNKLTVFRGSWIADYADAENYLSLFYSKNFSPGGANYTHFSNPDFDKLFEQARKETDDLKRIELYKKMDKIVVENSPFIILYYDQVLRFSQKNISGLGINGMNNLSLKRVKKTRLVN